ncbi:hypothetical protein EJB05_12010, partial [Eragrostis curvula]
MASLLHSSSLWWLMVVVAATSLLVGSAATAAGGFRLELRHVDSKGNFTKSQLVQRAAHRSRVRAAVLSGGSTTVVSTSAASANSWDVRPNVHWSHSEYVVELQIGTPPVPFVAAVETSSDLIWTQSRPCTRCAYQPTPVYDPRTSRSFVPEPCSSAMCRPPLPRFNQLDYTCSGSNNSRRPLPQRCQYSYNDTVLGASTKGVMGRETLTFPGSRPGTSVSISGIAFGCGQENTGRIFNSTGTLGLGRGPLSLLSQLGIGKFSYCLTDYFLPRRTSPLLFGSLADLGGGATVQNTPLFQSRFDESGTLYYVNLRGISIGPTRLPIPDGVFDFQQSDGSGGVVFDSTLSFTLLEERAFQEVVTHIAALLEGITPAPRPRSDNYMVLLKDQSEMCLAMGAIQGGSVIGNFQQQNMHLLFDIIGGYLSFVPADCSKL